MAGTGKKANRNSDAGAAFWIAGGRALQALIESIGLPGTSLVLGYEFVVKYASDEQKRAIIDTYVLWRGPHSVATFVLYSVSMVFLMFAQKHYYTKKINALQNEVDRIGEEKSALQEKLSLSPIHHSAGKKSS